MEALDGERSRVLIDTGWNADYMRQRFAATGAGKLLAAGEIEALFITHEHIDHLFGLQAALELRPDIPVYILAGFQPEAYGFLAGTSFPAAGAKNAIVHSGRLIRLENGGVHQLMPGLAAVGFGLPVILGIVGEQSLYANVQGKGLVAITGCGHQTLTRITAFAAENLAGGDKLHGLHGGLHLAPFGPLAPAQEAVIRDMGQYGFVRIARRGNDDLAGIPGRQRNRLTRFRYIGNGDSVVFG